MATTTKTLTPTNQTVTLPDMTERPNASVLVDGIGKEADAINALSEQIVTQWTKNNSSWLNSSYISSGDVSLLKISNLCIVQFADVKFSQAITNSSESNSIELFTLPYTANNESQIFIMNRANDNAATIRLRINANSNKITPLWTAIPKTESGEGWFGILVFKAT